MQDYHCFCQAVRFQVEVQPAILSRNFVWDLFTAIHMAFDSFLYPDVPVSVLEKKI